MGNKKKEPSQEQMQNTAKALVDALTSETKGTTNENTLNGYSNRTVGIAERLADLVNHCRSTLPIVDILNTCGCLDTKVQTEFRRVFFDNYTNDTYKDNMYSKFVADIRDNKASIRELVGIFCICRDICDRLYGRELDKNGNKKMLSLKYVLTGKGSKYIYANTTDISKVKYSVIEQTLYNAIGITTDNATKYRIDELATMIENCGSKFDEILIHYAVSMTHMENPSEIERRKALTEEDTDAVKVITGTKGKKEVNSVEDNLENEKEEEVEEVTNFNDFDDSFEHEDENFFTVNEEDEDFDFLSEEDFAKLMEIEEPEEETDKSEDVIEEQPYEEVYCDYGESEQDETEKGINPNHVYYVLEKRDGSSLLYNISTGETEYHSNSMKNVIENGDVNGILKSINYSFGDEVERALRLVTLIIEQDTLLRVKYSLSQYRYTQFSVIAKVVSTTQLKAMFKIQEDVISADDFIRMIVQSHANIETIDEIRGF